MQLSTYFNKKKKKIAGERTQFLSLKIYFPGTSLLTKLCVNWWGENETDIVLLLINSQSGADFVSKMKFECGSQLWLLYFESVASTLCITSMTFFFISFSLSFIIMRFLTCSNFSKSFRKVRMSFLKKNGFGLFKGCDFFGKQLSSTKLAREIKNRRSSNFYRKIKIENWKNRYWRIFQKESKFCLRKGLF